MREGFGTTFDLVTSAYRIPGPLLRERRFAGRHVSREGSRVDHAECPGLLADPGRRAIQAVFDRQGAPRRRDFRAPIVVASFQGDVSDRLAHEEHRNLQAQGGQEFIRVDPKWPRVAEDWVGREWMMSRSWVIASAVLVFAGCSDDPSQDRTAPAGTTPSSSASSERVESPSREASGNDASQVAAVVGDSAVGCLEIGVPVEEVRRSCGPVSDTTIYLESMAQEAAWVGVRQGRVLAEIVNDSVWRISVVDPVVTTRDSISVGTPVRALAHLPGIRIVHGEGSFARTDVHCGISFQIRGLSDRPRRWSPAEIGELPDSVKIARILVLGRCDPP
jgi:hypothetical protein